MEPAQRTEAMSAAASASAEVPRAILGCCVAIAEAGERLAGRSNPNLASDLMCASRAVEAAAHCAAENVLVNLPNFADRAEAETVRAETKRMVADVERLARATRRAIAKGGPRPPERPKAGDIAEPGGENR
jgi:formiminotetrahydrofolate cyclodeaminase